MNVMDWILLDQLSMVDHQISDFQSETVELSKLSTQVQKTLQHQREYLTGNLEHTINQETVTTGSTVAMIKDQTVVMMDLMMRSTRMERRTNQLATILFVDTILHHWFTSVPSTISAISLLKFALIVTLLKLTVQLVQVPFI